jgi:hypothetical protein
MISCMKRIPRAAGLLGWTLGAVALHAAVPFQLSRLGRRAGLPARTTPGVRSVGLLTVAAGASLMAWAFAAQYQAAPRGWAMQSPPAADYLVRAGPYRLSRNRIHVGVEWSTIICPVTHAAGDGLAVVDLPELDLPQVTLELSPAHDLVDALVTTRGTP